MPAPAPDARPQTPDPGRLRLGRKSRLGQNRDFTRVRQQGQRLAQGCLIANWNRLPDGAVERSRARRLLRESFRQHQHELSQPVELVLVARPSIAGRGFAEVEKDLLTALNRAGLLPVYHLGFVIL